jgi:Pirin
MARMLRRSASPFSSLLLVGFFTFQTFIVGFAPNTSRRSFVSSLSTCPSVSKATEVDLQDQQPLENDEPQHSMNGAASKFRSVRRVMPRPNAHWVGDGFRVYPVFADLAFTNELSPLLMFDYGEPKKFPARVGAPLGVGQHPHRGFETVTVAFQGEVEHKDSKGNSGVIGPGDVQWMTAGKGIVHEEYHSREFTRNGGEMEVSIHIFLKIFTRFRFRFRVMSSWPCTKSLHS